MSGDDGLPAAGVEAVRGVLANAKPVGAKPGGAKPGAAKLTVVAEAPATVADKPARKRAAKPKPPVPVEDQSGADSNSGGDNNDAPARRRRRTPIDAETGLPEGCPIIALGVRVMKRYYLDGSKQLIEIAAEKLGRITVLALFGAENQMVYEFWPRLNAQGDVVGWRPEQASEQLLAAAARAGVFDAHEQVRGAGAWRGPGDELILNCGDGVWIGPTRSAWREAQDAAARLPVAQRDDYLSAAAMGKWRDAGVHGRFVYPAGVAMHRPETDWPGASRRFDLTKPGDELLKVLSTWNWKRGEIDALMILGWIAAAMLGGALKWRPMAWVTGGKGTGKSTLQMLIDVLFGPSGLLDAVDTTAAGIWQLLGHSTVPVAVDELEPSADNTKVNAVIKLARIAASGGRMMRGGADHGAVSFTIKSCFLFSSILVPPLLGQDRSRMAILDLDDLDRNAPVPSLPAEAVGALGKALRLRLARQWHRHDETVEIYRAVLQAEGFNARGQDQFGALLAAADLALRDFAPTGEMARELAMKLAGAHLADKTSRAMAELSVLSPLLAWRTEGGRPGEKTTLAECIERLLAAQTPAQQRMIVGEAEEIDNAAKQAKRILVQHGVRLETRDGVDYIAVANAHPELSRIYNGTDWATPRGAEQSVWMQALSRIPGAKPSGQTLWFGFPQRAILVPVELAIERKLERDDMSAADGAAVAPPSF
jgi:hypothetical protein